MEIQIVPAMDCEPPKSEIPSYAHRRSGSGPDDYAESKRSIAEYVDVFGQYGHTPTLFVHPQVAERQREFLSDLRERGVCLGLHLHPYKMDESYRHDLGAYDYPTQKAILTEATRRWEDAIGNTAACMQVTMFGAKLMRAIRRDLHARPEPGWLEYRTTALVAAELDERGFELALDLDAALVAGARRHPRRMTDTCHPAGGE